MPASTKAKPKSPPEKKTNRVLVFEALARRPGGMTATEIKQKINMTPAHGQLGIILRSEIIAGRIRVKQEEREDSFIENVHYLTALGLKHLRERKINSYARQKHLAAVGRNEIEFA